MMYSRSCLGVVLLAIGFAAVAQEDASSNKRIAALPWFSHVTGFCWRSQLSEQTKDRQCFREQFGRVVRVGQQIAQPDGVLNADSLYAWDPRIGKLRHVFWASDGAFESATGWIEGDALILYLDRETDARGEVPARTVLRKTGPDRYSASREGREGTRWREQFSFVYERDGRATD